MLNAIEQIGELIMVLIWLLGEFIEDHLTPAVDSCYSDNAGLDNPRKAGSFLGRNEGEIRTLDRRPQCKTVLTVPGIILYCSTNRGRSQELKDGERWKNE